MPGWEEFKPVLNLQDRKSDMIEQLKLKWREGKRRWSDEDALEWIRINSVHRNLEDIQVRDFLNELGNEGYICLHGLKQRYMDILRPEFWGKGKQAFDYKKELKRYYRAYFQRSWDEGLTTWSKKQIEGISQHDDPRKSLADEDVKAVINDMVHDGYVIVRGNEDVYLEVIDPARWAQ